MDDLLLGKKTTYPQKYDRSVLDRVARIEKRIDIPYSDKKFKGRDVWNCFEISFLDPYGLPQVFIGQLSYPSDSKFIVESKSLKLYLNSFNMTNMPVLQVQKTVNTDLNWLLECDINFTLYDLIEYNELFPIKDINSVCLEDRFAVIDPVYEVDPEILEVGEFKRVLCHSNVLRSNCLVTGQPDWATISFDIRGDDIPSEESLLKYIVSFRNHQEFHEQCVERIISTLVDRFNIEYGIVKANYTRRGGIDINPIRVYGGNGFGPLWARSVRQ